MAHHSEETQVIKEFDHFVGLDLNYIGDLFCCPYLASFNPKPRDERGNGVGITTCASEETIFEENRSFLVSSYFHQGGDRVISGLGEQE